MATATAKEILKQQVSERARQRLRDIRTRKAQHDTDLESFAGDCLRIRPKTGGEILLRFNAVQRLVHEKLEVQKRETGRVRALILKARQPGVSTYVELRFDQIVRLIQQKAEELGRSIKLKISSGVSGLEIPDPESGKFLRGNATNDGYDNVDIAGQGALALPVAIAEGGTGATTVSGAQANLGVAAMTVAENQRLVRARRLALFNHGGL